MEHVKDGSIVQVIATGRIGEVISRKKRILKSIGSVPETFMPG